MSLAEAVGDSRVHIDFDQMRAEKLRRARNAAKGHGLDCILTLNGTNTSYVTFPSTGGREPMNRYAILYQNDPPSVLLPGTQCKYSKEVYPDLDVDISIPSITSFAPAIWHERALTFQRKKFVELVRRKLKEHGLLSGTLGLDSHDSALVKDLEEQGINISLEGSKALWEARMIKTRDEVECQRQVCAIIEACIQRVRELIKPGMTENELVANVHYAAYMSGASYVESTRLKTGDRTWSGAGFCAPPAFTRRAIRPGDIIYYDIGSHMSYYGYRGECYRTFSCGRPTQAQKDTYARLIDFQREGAKAIKPGATTKDIVEKWPAAEECNLPNEDAAVGLQTAHGVGLEVHEPPMASRAWSLDYPVKLEAGMTLAVETLLPTREKTPYPNGQAVRLEDMVHIKDTGVEWLTRYPEDEIIVCEL